MKVYTSAPSKDKKYPRPLVWARSLKSSKITNSKKEKHYKNFNELLHVLGRMMTLILKYNPKSCSPTIPYPEEYHAKWLSTERKRSMPHSIWISCLNLQRLTLLKKPKNLGCRCIISMTIPLMTTLPKDGFKKRLTKTAILENLLEKVSSCFKITLLMKLYKF